jgi:arylsulfatase
MATKKTNILILWDDDIGWWNISFNNRGQMGYRTPISTASRMRA